MDKYNGINRPHTVYKDIVYKTLFKEGKNNDRKDKSLGKAAKKDYKKIFTIVRYLVSMLLLCVCLMGKYTDFKPFNQASQYIKTHLQQDIVQEVLKR